MFKRVAKIITVASIAVSAIAFSLTGSIYTAAQTDSFSSSMVIEAANPLYRVPVGQ